MKKLLLPIFVFLFVVPVSGQERDTLPLSTPTHIYESVIGISPLQLIPLGNIRVKYERVINSRSSWGVLTNIQTPIAYIAFASATQYPKFGITINPVYRYYYSGSAPLGWYVECELTMGMATSYQHKFMTEDDDMPMFSAPYGLFGVGVNAGTQFAISKDKRWTMDLNIGLSLAENTIDEANYIYFPLLATVYIGDPFSPISGLINIGYRF